MIDPVEGMSPFGVEGFFDNRATSVRPLSAFHWKHPHVDGSQDLRFGYIVMARKSQECYQMLWEWTGDALACKCNTPLAWRVLPGQQVAELAFKLLDALFQLDNAALQGFRDMSRHVSRPQDVQVTDCDLTTVRLWVLGRKFSRTDCPLDRLIAHIAKLCGFLDTDIFALDHLTSSCLPRDMPKAYHVSRQVVQGYEKEGPDDFLFPEPSCPDRMSG